MTTINWDLCTTGRVAKRKGLTLARLRRTVKKLMAEKAKLRCGCTPYLRADGGIILVTAAGCREHNEDTI